MITLWRPLAVAVALNAGVGAGLAAAQTVIVRQAPAGEKVEVVLNTTTVGSAAADGAGDATVAASLSEHLKKNEIDAFIFVEECEALHRILIIERGSAAPPVPDGCERRDVPGLFLVRRQSTIVVDVAGAIPTVLLVQGRFDPSAPDRGTLWRPPPEGLVLFGGAGLSTFSNVGTLACGNLPDCDVDDTGLAYSAGATYWLSPYLGVEGSFVRPGDAAVSGRGDRLEFDSFLDAYFVTLTGKVGIPARAMRLYGQGGATYHRATFGTTQTVQDVTRTVDGETVTIPGGTQSFQLETAGWGWTLGGGIEAWMTRSFGFYGEFNRSTLKGSALEDEEGTLDEGVTSVVLGIRLRIGG